ncbi:FxSxx-COOH system tetratricopeptide repeat protein [Cryptosporangium aurantiacum]|uniref:MinD-like ATPase involved in chromosome partitioning or flagellar assembly n=1 Tax=Cryptosporangium aurantiacum TaxID=134849 RepID=A0A1M7L287_9ACTN|nr:FxSxx-COOH system tetratricopeptide repeat protein [Cryptosporangium aurantiacum]SHM71783.1 MinD-like ATPase involved in chromosome partitioning or flagellar assembly [Cryptosporangium aurantiacum]
MTAEPTGVVVTFYSFKGGTGRTMALANVAWILAANGKRVLAVDWDLESPGLHRYFSPFVDRRAIRTNRGVIGLIHDFQNAKARSLASGGPELDVNEHADISTRVIPLDWPDFPDGGRLDLLSAGKHSRDYAKSLASVDWDDFYTRLDGGRFFQALRTGMKQQYDYVLIDSRTGYSDVADICTIELPDVLVDCFTLNEQGIDGAATVAHLVLGQKPNMRILPVPMRLDPAEKVKADAGRAAAQQRFGEIPTFVDRAERDRYWSRVYIPYQAFYNYEEVLATFGDTPQTPGTLLAAYELLTKELTEGAIDTMPPMSPTLRRAFNAQFERRIVVAETDVALRYAVEDTNWAEWLGHVLLAAGVRVVDPIADPRADTSGCRDLLIMSDWATNDPSLQLTPLGATQSALAVYVADIPPAQRTSAGDSIFISRLTEAAAVEAVLRLVGRTEAVLAPEVDQGSPRFPAEEPFVSNLGARNARFTGRENELRTLRRQLSSSGTIVVSSAKPVALQGMGGIGKTQIALEYAHQFRSAYDVIWWIKADPVTFIDVQLEDLGRRLELPLGASGPENARAVLDALRRGVPHKRWLLIFDNAEDSRVGDFLPSGPGHVLITSRTTSWGDRTRTVPIDVFDRRESVEHFRSRTPTITSAEANQLAELLGDLPIAVAAAAAFLAESRFPVESLVQEIEARGPAMIPLPDQAGTPSDQTQTQPVQALWDVSLNRLHERSVAAYRLLQLCSVMDTSVALDLIYGEEMAQALTPYDPSLTERLLRGRMVQEIARLALARVEPRSEGPGGEVSEGRLSVHRLVQYVVRSRMSDEELEEARHHVHLVLARSRPPGEIDDPGTWPRFRTLWPHLERSKAVECDDPVVRQLLIERVRYLWVGGDYQRGLERARQTEAVWVARLDRMAADHVVDDVRQTLRGQLLHLRFNMANLLRSLGDFEESRTLDEEVLREQQDLLGDDHPLTLITAGSAAGDLRGLGHYQEALKRDQRTYAAWQDLFGEGHARTLAALNNLATSYRLIGDYRQALELDVKAYEGRRGTLGERHPSTLYSAGHIGRDLREGGEYEQSVRRLRVVADVFAEELSAEARDTLNARVNLAVSLRTAGHLEEAEELLHDAYDRLSDKFPYAPDTLSCRLSRAVVLLRLGNDIAGSELRAVYDAYQRSFGPQHPYTLICLNNQVAAAHDAGDRSRARELADEVARDFSLALGQDHPYTLAAEMNLGIALAEIDAFDRALTLFASAVDRSARFLGERHPDTLSGAANRALIEVRAGSAGPDIVEKAVRRLSERVGRTHPTVLTIEQERLVTRLIDPLPF